MAESSSPIQNQLVLLAQPAAAASSRRLPPPCWSHDETVALIEAYRDKWYSLRRGNLRANHWQEVADDVAGRCPPPSETPAKTSVQCRHKMEKLRKRYRAELQRTLSNPIKGHRLTSSWVHFKRMEYMEKGPASAAAAADLSPEDNNDEDDGDDDDPVDEEEELYQSVRRGGGGVTRQINPNPSSNGLGGKSGFRIRLPGYPSGPTPQGKIYTKNNPNPSRNPSFGSTRGLREGFEDKWGFGKRSGGGGEGGGRKREGEAVGEIVGAIKALGDGFVRMERMKMDMAREVEAMRMEMEMKRTEMILESQQRIVEAFGKAFSEKRNKRVKRMPTPES